MLKPRRRLFRRRESWEWIKRNAYAGVALIALAIAAVGWSTIIEQESLPSQEEPLRAQEAPRTIADERVAADEVQPLAAAAPATSLDDLQLSAPVAAPSPVRSAIPRTENVQIRKLATAKPRQVARASRAARAPTAKSGKRHARIVRGSARHRSHVTSARHRSRVASVRHRGHLRGARPRVAAREDKSEAVYSGRSPGNMAPIP